MTKIIVTGGTILSGRDKTGLLGPKYKVQDLLDTAKRYHPSIPTTAIESQEIYYKDSQEFDLSTDGAKITKALKENDGDLIFITGTDTIKWFAKHISNIEKEIERKTGKKRKVAVVSSMYDMESSPEHVANLYAGTHKFIEDATIKDGVYVVSATNDKATDINVLNAEALLSKVSCVGTNAIIGSNITHSLKVNTDDVKITPKCSLLHNKEEDRLFNFIGDSKMKLLPLIAGNSPTTILRYYSKLQPNDVAVIEIDKNFINNPKYLKAVSLLAKYCGLKIVLFNRSFYNPETKEFETVIPIQEMKKFQQDIKDDKIFVTNETSNFYSKLACGDPQEFKSIIPYSTLTEETKLGVRYIPNSVIATNTLNNLGKTSKLTFESLPGGFFPQYLLDLYKENSKDHSTEISLHPTYAETKTVKKQYSASAEETSLKKYNIKMDPYSDARDAMESLAKDTAPKWAQKLAQQQTQSPSPTLH